MIVTRTEQIHIPYDSSVSHLCHISKNLWNEALYDMRHVYFHNIRPENKDNKQRMPSYNNLAGKFKTSENAKQLYSSTAQWILKKLSSAWQDSYFKGLAEWKVHPSKFTGKPGIPNYKPKDGEYMLVFTNQACTLNSYKNFASGKEGENNKYLKIIKQKYGTIKEGETYLLFPDNTGIKPVKTRLDINTHLREVRIIPQGEGYNIEIVYDKEVTKLDLDKSRIVGIDYGLSNIVAMANNIGTQPIVVKGSIVKSINQWYNKRRADLYRIYDRQPIACRLSDRRLIFNRDTKKLQKTITHRNRLMRDIMHKISRYIVNYCIEHNVGTIVIGHNDMWKQNINIGARNNQNFVTIPYYILTKDIEYKGSEIGINVILKDEAHTSKCSFLDNEPIEHHDVYVGKRIKRGLFKSAKGIIVNADVHAGANIIRKVFLNAFEKLNADGIAASGLMPESLSIKNLM